MFLPKTSKNTKMFLPKTSKNTKMFIIVALKKSLSLHQKTNPYASSFICPNSLV